MKEFPFLTNQGVFPGARSKASTESWVVEAMSVMIKDIGLDLQGNLHGLGAPFVDVFVNPFLRSVPESAALPISYCGSMATFEDRWEQLVLHAMLPWQKHDEGGYFLLMQTFCKHVIAQRDEPWNSLHDHLQPDYAALRRDTRSFFPFHCSLVVGTAYVFKSFSELDEWVRQHFKLAIDRSCVCKGGQCECWKLA
jgi:hypothetical protein